MGYRGLAEAISRPEVPPEERPALTVVPLEPPVAPLFHDAEPRRDGPFLRPQRSLVWSWIEGLFLFFAFALLPLALFYLWR